MNKMKRLFLSISSLILKWLLSGISPLLIMVGFLDKYVLVRMDGGICSQMHFYLIGNLFRKKGLKVKYDLGWFVHEGFDMNGLYVRNFDLLKAFPDILFEKASRVECFLYKAFEYQNDYNDLNNPFKYTTLYPPVYLTGYYRDPLKIYEDIPLLFKRNITVLDFNNQQMLSIIEQKTPSVAVHIRRGDLASFNFAYGDPVSSSYINHAIDFVENKVGKSFFFIFSDEPEWVKNQLIRHLRFEENYLVVDINGSEKGYMDLFLIAACNHFITSKGSLGKYGAFLSNQGGIITVFDDEYEKKKWEGTYPNIYFIKP